MFYLVVYISLHTSSKLKLRRPPPPPPTLSIDINQYWGTWGSITCCFWLLHIHSLPFW